MITRRDVAIAVVASCVTFTVVAMAQSNKTLMSSTVFDWSQIAVKETRTGSTRDFFRGPTATLDELECHVTTVNQGQASHAAHAHPEEELIIIKEGTLESTQNGQTKTLGAGSIIFEASNELHGIRNAGTGPVTYYVIKWKSPGSSKK
jgi:XRE family transcriptional regulator, regulator of sulfur utilization